MRLRLRDRAGCRSRGGSWLERRRRCARGNRRWSRHCAYGNRRRTHCSGAHRRRDRWHSRFTHAGHDCARGDWRFLRSSGTLDQRQDNASTGGGPDRRCDEDDAHSARQAWRWRQVAPFRTEIFGRTHQNPTICNAERSQKTRAGLSQPRYHSAQNIGGKWPVPLPILNGLATVTAIGKAWPSGTASYRQKN